MNKNIGTTDRIFRLVLGVIILTLGIFYQSWWGLVGLVPLLTGLVHVCPLYKIFKLSTIRKNTGTV